MILHSSEHLSNYGFVKSTIAIGTRLSLKNQKLVVAAS